MSRIPKEMSAAMVVFEFFKNCVFSIYNWLCCLISVIIGKKKPVFT
jgi:hypothetical protein